jgi:osmotically-inducible protein OsmY
MTTDRELQEQVLSALEWEPGVDAAHIGVSVDAGVVTLQGVVTTYFQKIVAERTARRVYGVRAIANDLAVKPTSSTSRSDADIAKVIANALSWDSAIPPNAVKATVDGGFVTLTGQVTWQFQRQAAEAALRHLYGIKGVNNAITVKPHVAVSDVKAKIEAAFTRSAEIDARNVHVEARDGGVVLTGTVHSLFERDEAERAAWSAAGVSRVEDRIVVTV